MQYLFTSPTLDTHLQAIPGTILYEEISRVMSSLDTLGIQFSVSYITNRLRDGKPRKPPYLSCRYNVGDLEGVNIVAFYHLLISDWELMERRATWYRVRIRSVIRKEVIHAIQLKTVKARYDQSIEIQNNHLTAEAYYESLLDKIVQELIVTSDGVPSFLRQLNYTMKIGPSIRWKNYAQLIRDCMDEMDTSSVN